MRIMYDSVTPRNILQHDTNPAIVAGYVNGRYAWGIDDWALFPNSRKLMIAVRANEFSAHVLDCENGDATPDECPDWALTRRNVGGFPIIYCNRDYWPRVQIAFLDRAMTPPLYWIATANGKAEIPVGAIGAQYLLNWQGVDVSIMDDYIPGLDTLPTPISYPHLFGDDMTESFDPGNNVHASRIIPAGAKEIYFGITGYGDTCIIYQCDYWGVTDNVKDPKGVGNGVGGGFTNLTLGPNRPGPLPLPPNDSARIVTVRYTANCKVSVGFR